MSGSGASAPDAGEVRAGSRVLSVFENPLNARILRAHARGPLRFSALQEQIGTSAATTLRVAVASLLEAGALAKLPAAGSGYGAATVLSPAGEEMLAVGDAVATWLGRCPGGPIAPDSEEAKEAVKALAGGWSSRLIRALAGRPRTLAELHRLIPEVSYPSLERRISWMRAMGQIEPHRRRACGLSEPPDERELHELGPEQRQRLAGPERKEGACPVRDDAVMPWGSCCLTSPS